MNRPLSRAALAGLFALTSCSSWQAPSAPPQTTDIPPGPDRVARGKGPAAEPKTPSGRFARLRDLVLDRWLGDDPALGRELGLHQFDGRVTDCSPAAIEARWTRIQKEREELAAIDKNALSQDEQLDLAILISQADLFLFKGKDMVEWKKRPQFYESLFAVNAYLDRDYAPIEQRVQKLHEHELAALAQSDSVVKNLAGPMSKAVLEVGIKNYKGYAEYLRNDVVKQVKGVGTPAFQEQFAKTNEALAVKIMAIAEHLQKTELPRGDDSHVLGPEKYKKLLATQEGLAIPLAEFKKMGEENLAANKRAYDRVAKKSFFKRPKAGDLLSEATRLTEASRVFVEAKKIATIPTTEKAILRETPPFMRWNAASLDAPGPFEKAGQTAFYYITMPDASWPKKEQEEYIMPFGILLSTTIHEVYPGHFLQGQWMKKAPTRVQKALASYSFVEGWAHYGEQVMIEEGFGAESAESQLGQVSDALLRNCRFVVSLGIHTEGMSLKQAELRFQNDCHQDKATAREQAVRGTFDPGYFAYTLGKIRILALRDEAKKRLGPKFSLQKFHDALLSHGTRPVPLIRDRVLKELADGAK